VDPITHSLTGAILGTTRLRRTTPLATTTLILAANAPDVDAVAALGGIEMAVAFRRGITHGFFAIPFLAAGLTGLVAGWDRFVRRRRDPGAPPIRAKAVFLLALLGILTHPFLDWMNTYGMRFWLPFDGRWSYGDAIFILDPWLWLGMGGVVFLAHSRRRASLSAWIVLWLFGTALVLLTEPPPPWTKGLWIAGSLAFAVARWRRFGYAGPGRERVAAVGTALACAYILAMVAASAAAERIATAEIQRGEAGAIGAGRQIHEVMFGPEAADPLRGYLVIVTDDAYLQGTFDWLRRPRARLEGPEIPKARWIENGVAVSGDAETELEVAHGDLEAVIAAARRQDAGRRYLLWSRFPFFEISPSETGLQVLIGDARFAGIRPARGLAAVDIFLEPEGHDDDPPAP
jgi:inner membrane protein